MSRPNSRERADALLIDLDGVLRVFTPGHAAVVEQRFGLPAGSIAATVLHWGRVRPAITGAVSHEQWLAGAAQALADEAPSAEVAREAVRAWAADRGALVPVVRELVREVRAAGLPVALATNSTDVLDADLARFGLLDEFDAVVNSSVVGHHKPTGEFFTAACAAVGTPPGRCLLVDDDDRMVRGARVAGLSAYRYTGPEGLRYVRAVLARPRAEGART